MNFPMVIYTWASLTQAHFTPEFFTYIQLKRYSTDIVFFLTYPQYILPFSEFLENYNNFSFPQICFMMYGNFLGCCFDVSEMFSSSKHQENIFGLFLQFQKKNYDCFVILEKYWKMCFRLENAFASMNRDKIFPSLT